MTGAHPVKSITWDTGKQVDLTGLPIEISTLIADAVELGVMLKWGPPSNPAIDELITDLSATVGEIEDTYGFDGGYAAVDEGDIPF